MCAICDGRDPAIVHSEYGVLDIEEPCPNPIVRRTMLRAYPGWQVREYANGIFDATDNIGLTMGYDSFSEAVAAVRAEKEAFRRETAATQQMVADMERDGLL